MLVPVRIVASRGKLRWTLEYDVAKTNGQASGDTQRARFLFCSSLIGSFNTDQLNERVSHNKQKGPAPVGVTD